MSDHKARPGFISEEEIEAAAWQLEAATAKIRQDPHAALAAGLARVRAPLIAEFEADVMRLRDDLREMRAKTEVAMAKTEAEYAAKQCAKLEAFEARLRAKFEAAEAEIEHALAERLRRVNAATTAEPDLACAIVAMR